MDLMSSAVRGEVSYKDNHIMDKLVTQLLRMNLQNNLSYNAHLTSGKKPLLLACRRLVGLLARLGSNLSQ